MPSTEKPNARLPISPAIGPIAASGTTQPVISPGTLAGSLPAAYRQLLQVARALAFDCRILVLDEPTTALTDAEADHLFTVLEKLKRAGTTLLYVSHRLPEVFRLCERITVLRAPQVLPGLVHLQRAPLHRQQLHAERRLLEEGLESLFGGRLGLHHPSRGNDPGVPARAARKCASSATGRPVAPLSGPLIEAVPAMSRCAHGYARVKRERKHAATGALSRRPRLPSPTRCSTTSA